MKIILLNFEFPPIGGGAANATMQLLRQFAGRSVLSLDVLTCAAKPGLVEEHFSDNIRIYKVGIHKKDFHFWRKSEVIEWLIKAGFFYRKLLRENNYDLAHSFFAFPTGWLCYRNADKLPYIISLRGSDVPGYNIRLSLDYKLMAGLFRRIWSGAAAIIANSGGLQKLALDFIPNLDIKVIPNGIDTGQFHPAEKQNPTKTIQALTVCRLISRKRIDLLIKAVAGAKELGLDVRLNIAGDGNIMDSLKNLAKELNVADKITFLGVVPAGQMPQVYRENDIYVMSSAHEGMSNAMLEAMASGLPIITTRCEGVDELITANGIILEQADPMRIADAIKILANDPAMRQKMSLAARMKAESFTWSSVAEQYLNCYKEVLDSKI
jgi:L-malate glycosyltransferase